MGASTDNASVAGRLFEAAHLLNARRASPYRAAAYRAAGSAITHHPHDVRRIFERDGVKGLDAIPHVGLGIACAIAEMLSTHRWALLERLRDEADPATLFESLPGIGAGLARRIRDELHVASLEALETAANDGRLEHVRGVGPRRAAAMRGSLDHVLRPFSSGQLPLD